jgi:hypothetical protein
MVERTVNQSASSLVGLMDHMLVDAIARPLAKFLGRLLEKVVVCRLRRRS